MSKSTIRQLAALELFASCRRVELEKIDQLGVVLDVPAGRMLCVEGQPGDEFFVLLSGVADVRTASGTAALVFPGGWFGETALIDGGPRRATVAARCDSTVLVLNRAEFRQLLEIAPAVHARLHLSASRIVGGAAPTRQPWYQPLPASFPFMLGVS
jgi:CRP/FNR family transcriptional regulator, cyclic AMP receptor protein